MSLQGPGERMPCLGHTTALSFSFLLNFFISPHSSLVQLTFSLLWMLNQILNRLLPLPHQPISAMRQSTNFQFLSLALRFFITLFILFVILLLYCFLVFWIYFHAPHSELIWCQPTLFSCSSRTHWFPVLLPRCSLHNLLRVSVVARNDSKEEERTVSSRLLSLLKLVKKANFLGNEWRNNLWLASPNCKYESPSATQTV